MNRVVEELNSQLLRDVLGEDVIAAYVFGSQVTGTADDFSDIDLAVLYRNDKLPGPRQLAELTVALESEYHVPVDLIVLNKAPVELQFKVLSEGELLLDCDKQKRLRFLERVLRYYHDLRPFLQKFREEIADAVRTGDSNG